MIVSVLIVPLALSFSPVAISQQIVHHCQVKSIAKAEVHLSCGRTLLDVEVVQDGILHISIGLDSLSRVSAYSVGANAAPDYGAQIRRVSANKIEIRSKLFSAEILLATAHITLRDSAGRIFSDDMEEFPPEFHGSAFRIYKQMPPGEHYFGLGDKPGNLDRRGGAFTFWNTDAYRFQESTDPLYKTIPFALAYNAGHAYGILLDNTWKSSFDFGKERRDAFSFGAEGGVASYYIFAGPDAKSVLAQYTSLVGRMPLPPLWALGFQQSRYSYRTEQDVLDIANRLRQDRIPADAIYFDIDYQDRNRPFTIDRSSFLHFESTLQKLHDLHFHPILITDLHIADLPDQHYAPYDTGIKEDHFLKSPDGNLFVGIVWPGKSVFPEFTRWETRKWWGTLYAEFVKMGASGFWNDMNEPSVFQSSGGTLPIDTPHRVEEKNGPTRTADEREVHNIYGMLNSRATYEGLRTLKPEERPFVLTRASYTGGQKYAATWTGDNSSTWNHLRISTPMLLNLGISGFALSGDDIGGYAGSTQADLLTKWIEVGAFNPIFRDHSEKGTRAQEPWTDGPAQLDIRRKFIEERYRLLPYIYTAIEEASRTGMPVMRPLFFEFLHATTDGHPLDLDAGNQFLLGSALLVAPTPYPEQPDAYDVLLPKGGWFNYWSGERIKTEKWEPSVVSTGESSGLREIETFRVVPALDQLPVFVRAGSILPRAPLVQSTDEHPDGPLEIHIYPGPSCRGSLYADDGRSYRYTQGEYLRIEMSCVEDTEGISFHMAKPQGTFQPWWKQIEIHIHGIDHPMVVVEGKVSLPASYDSNRHELLFRLNASAEDVAIRIANP